MQNRRWAVIDDEGVHTWLGNGTDPSPAFLFAVPIALDVRGAAGWLTSVSGDYWHDENVEVRAVRLITKRNCGSEQAIEAFHRRRAVTLGTVA